MKGSVKLPVFIDDARKYVNTTQLRAKYLGASYEAEYCQWQALHGLGSLMETASLIITPNAFLEGKLIASYPPDPIGDFDVVRATTATRVNSAGLVELVPYNLVSYSEQFDNTSVWGAVDTTITANTTIAPNGLTTADTMVISSSTSRIYRATSTSKGTYTASIYVKSLSGTPTIQFRMVVDGADITDSIPTTTEWVRHDYTFTANISVDYFIIRGESGTGNVAIWGAQLVEGTLPKDYQKTETRLNIPRLDYSNGTCPSMLVEPQRTNICKYSNNLSGADWINQIYNTTLTRIASGGADGGAYDRLVTTGSGNQGRYVQYSTLTGTSAVFSVYLRGSGISDIAIYNGGQSSLDQVTLTSEWTRYETKITSGIGGYIDWSIFSYGGSTIEVSCCQMEFGSYPTSYIPTTSASVTRNADVVSKTGISSLIGQTEGTLFLEIANIANDGGVRAISLNDGGIGNTIEFAYYGNNNYNFVVRSGGVATYVFAATLPDVTQMTKFAFVYKQNDFALYINGNQVNTSSSGNVPSTMTRLDFDWGNGGFNYFGDVKAIALWKTRLTNTQLAQLTTI